MQTFMRTAYGVRAGGQQGQTCKLSATGFMCFVFLTTMHNQIHISKQSHRLRLQPGYAPGLGAMLSIRRALWLAECRKTLGQPETVAAVRMAALTFRFVLR